MNTKIVMALLTCSLFLFGCAAQTFNINGTSGEVPTSQESQTFFLAGIGQEQSTDAAKICGGVDKVIKVQAQDTPLNILFRGITFGIYTPRDAKVYCKL